MLHACVIIVNLRHMQALVLITHCYTNFFSLFTNANIIFVSALRTSDIFFFFLPGVSNEYYFSFLTKCIWLMAPLVDFEHKKSARRLGEACEYSESCKYFDQFSFCDPSDSKCRCQENYYSRLSDAGIAECVLGEYREIVILLFLSSFFTHIFLMNILTSK